MNNLFQDYKHNKDFLELIHYKIGYKIYNLLLYKNHPNIIISGIKNSGKTLLIKTILNDVFNINKSLKKELLIDNIYYETSYYHYYFDLKLINNNEKLLDLMKKIINSYNYYTNKHNYIIFDNYEYLCDTIQNKLRVIFEKCVNTSKIIIITTKYNHIINPIKSRFLSIKIPLHNVVDKYLYFKHLFLRNLFIIDDDILYKIVEKHDNLDFILINILGYFKTKKINVDIYDEIINKYMIIIKSKNILMKKISNIKHLLYLAKSFINVNYFLKRLLSHLLEQNYNNEQKTKLVKEFTEYDIMINKSFRDLLCLEGLLIGVMDI